MGGRFISGQAQLLFICLAVMFSAACTNRQPPRIQQTKVELPSQMLRLSSSYFLKPPKSERFDFSGIAMLGKHSGYVVNDKASKIFLLRLAAKGQSTLKPMADLATLLPVGHGRFDLEAVRILSPDILLIANEALQEVIEWNHAANTAKLILGKVSDELEKKGFNPKFGLEALCPYEKELLLIKEQKPTTMVRANISTGEMIPISPLEGESQSSDITDCVFVDGILFLLNRNKNRILLARPKAKGYIVFATWNFSWIEQDKRFAYWTRDRDGKQRDDWGVAEALDVDDRYVYVGMDNNGQALRSDSSETRPLLLVFDRPR